MTDEVRTFPFQAEFQGELAPDVAELRARGRLGRVQLPNGAPAWLVLGYEEAQTVMSDTRFSRAVRYREEQAPACPGQARRSLGMDGPAHLALRRLAGQAFTARRVERLRSRIQEMTDGLLDAMAEAGPPADLMVALALPLPMLLICELMGLPAEDREQFAEWSRLMMNRHSGEAVAGEIEAAMRDSDAYLLATVARKRAAPADDILSGMVTASDGDDRLTDAECVDLAKAMLVAGHTTTVSMIGLGIWRLFKHPEQLAALRAEPGLIEGAVEEILRYQPQGVFAMPQVAAEDVELGGVEVRRGDLVFAPSYCGNRDDGHFPDPDRFDIARPPNGHLTFGHGPHFCLGAALARAELQIAYGTLLRRFPDLRLTVPVERVALRLKDFICCPVELPVTW